MKKALIGIGLLVGLFILALNSGFLADQAVDWVKLHPKDPDAPTVLYRAARWCDWMGSSDKAVEIYWQLYQQYPEKKELCAPALYYCAYIKANGSTITAFRLQANSYLKIITDQYPDVGDWGTKAKDLYDEVNHVH